MTETASIYEMQPQPIGFLDKLAALAAWGVGAAVFLTVGWVVMEPADPRAPLSVMARPDGWSMLLLAAVMAAVAGGLATMIAGRRLVDVGVFAMGLGLALVSFRGSTVEYLLILQPEPALGFERGLALRFLLESLGWVLVALVALVASTAVRRWVLGVSPQDRNPDSRSGSSPSADPDEIGALTAADDLGWVGREQARRTPAVDGLKHTAIAAGVAFVGVAIFSAGLSGRSVQHAQVCFVVAASVFMGTYTAYRFVPVRSALWPMLSVLTLVVAGYVWAALRPTAGVRPPSIPASPFLRVLPLQFVSVGLSAAVATFWYVYFPVAPDRAGPRPQRSAHRPRPRHTRR
ncbi:MAG: hypothetical protein ACE5EX_09415 [Phycisphaerae bacterium]